MSVFEKIMKAFVDYSDRRMTFGSFVIGLFFVCLLVYFLSKIIGELF